MNRWTRLCPLSEVPPGSMKGFEVGDEEVMVANVGGTLYAMANRCGHMNMTLAAGTLEGKVVTCCLHGAKFDVTTGQVVQPAPARDMNVKVGDQTRPVPQPKTLPRPMFKVRVDAGEVSVERGGVRE